MSGPAMGDSPIEVPLYLSDNADFIELVQYETSPGVVGNFPVGATLTIAFMDPPADTVTWAASISGSDATWHVDKASTTSALIPDGTRYQLRYVDGTADEVPVIGRVVRSKW